MFGVDDVGFVDHSFWDDLFGEGEQPTLRGMCERAAEWLRGKHLSAARYGGGGNDDKSGGVEFARRWRESEQHTGKKHAVVDKYRRVARHPELVAEDAALRPEWLHPTLRPLLAASRRAASAPIHASGGGPEGKAALEAAVALARGVNQPGGALTELVPGAGIFAFDAFTPEFCRMLADEVDAFEATDLPRRRPNTMNKAGLIVNEIGMASLMGDLLNAVGGCKLTLA